MLANALFLGWTCPHAFLFSGIIDRVGRLLFSGDSIHSLMGHL
jgi:hypothetical protein